ncbi:MAG: ATP-grasp domain-containing protein [Muribaculum sp.]|nr:ATP-grasp domain-containing protein [Muribaculum sp.]
MSKLLILGASILQVPAIMKAKELGHCVAVADYDPNAVGVPYADEFYNASTIDVDAIVAVAKNFRPNGIMTLATDMPMRSVAKASEILGLKSISYDTAVKATDKYEMIQAFNENNVPTPWYFKIESKEKLCDLEKDLSFPCIMKPTDNAGSHGVVLANNFNELIAQYDYCVKNSRKGNVIIEEYLEGDEVSVEVMVINGNVHILQITDKITTGSPHFVEMGHTEPSRKTKETQRQIKEVATKAVKAVGIDNGPSHVEMMVTNRGPVMIELGARMGGDNITTHLVPLSTGIDMTEATIKVAIGEIPDLIPKINKGSAIRYIQAPVGRIKAISGVEEAKSVAGVTQVSITKNVGDYSSEISCSNDRIGFIISQGIDAAHAAQTCEEALRHIKIEIDSL